jgi:hypothetical protein
MTSKLPSERGPGDAHAGFQAQIKGASLADLVQMECLAGSHRVVRVTSGGNLGFLYFRGGGLVHASTKSLSGEPAALDILSWSEGSFEPVEREWPARESISSGWQSLLLRAAQARDERSAQSVVALRSNVPRPPRELRESWAGGESLEIHSTPVEVLGHVLRAEDFEVVLRLDPDGTLEVNRGGSQEFADVAAYACRLTDIIGSHLGAERFVAMECTFKSGRCFVVAEPSGAVVALRPRAAADGAVRALLGL